jgi:murein DD-endopeptidase MepM/ murein hydrolase activator NlpD
MSFCSQIPRRALAPLLFVGCVVLGAAPVSAHSASPSTAPSTVRSLASCPVGGPSEFVDSWGDARSGGRRHEGVDMAAERGTPVLAARDGDAEFKRSNNGGNAIWLVTGLGERFYYAHLDAWEGTSRKVVAGEVVGYVGSSGNAKGDHLHFETRAGSRAVNPYPYVANACDTPGASAQRQMAMRPLRR